VFFTAVLDSHHHPVIFKDKDMYVDIGILFMIHLLIFQNIENNLFQGKTAAAASDALGATGKGTANYFIVIGVIETVALFTLVFCMLLLNTAAIA
jgi:F0F1-type ATP synthase membrane subunit c/vacuolar-type H+-ATPase subunit K